MSWKSILKEDNELDERVKVILEDVEDLKDKVRANGKSAH